MILRNKDIIIVGLQPWDNEIGSNCKNIAMEFAKHNRVLYVNNPMQRISLKREKSNPAFAMRIDMLKNKKENLLQVDKNLWNLFPACILESANFLPSTSLFRIVNRVNNQRFAGEIQKAADRLGFKDFILFNDSDMFRSYHLKELIRPALTVYYTRDNLMGFPYWYKHGHKLEPELFAKSDLVVANSTYLAELAAKHNVHAYYVGQGCETAEFDLQKIKTIPADIASIPKPIVGYMGVLFSIRLNLHLLEQLAQTKKDWNFVLIGPEDDAFKQSSLHKKDNVHFLGLKDASELPAYLAKFDVAINPQVVNEVTIGNYPRKIDEYLAMGKPTVATGTRAMSIFSDHVYFAETLDEYIAQIERAMKDHTPQKEADRIAFARSHTWEASVEEIYKAMVKVKPDLIEQKAGTVAEQK
jgi:glycosyltransferase involved in cell wall biosynthesis